MATRADRGTRRSLPFRFALPVLLALLLALVAGAQPARLAATDSVVRGPSASATTMMPSTAPAMDSAAEAAIDPEAEPAGSASPALSPTGLRTQLVGSPRTSRAPPAAL